MSLYKSLIMRAQVSLVLICTGFVPGVGIRSLTKCVVPPDLGIKDVLSQPAKAVSVRKKGPGTTGSGDSFRSYSNSISTP